MVGASPYFDAYRFCALSFRVTDLAGRDGSLKN